MSGHSKWANIRVRKTAEDARRGKIFTRHARLIEMAARAGGGDPAANATLRTTIENARAENVPNANIDRAIKKGTGELHGEQMAEILYAAYLPVAHPGGSPATAVATAVACLIECLTNNRNRTLANIRSIVGKHGGNFADTNAVAWMFERKGIVCAQVTRHELRDTSYEYGSKLEARSSKPIPQSPMHDSEGLELQLIDLGAEDIAIDGSAVMVTTNQHDWTKVRDFLKEKGWEVKEAGLKHIAKERVRVTDENALQKIAAFVDALEADDDVAEVFTNVIYYHL